MWIYGTLPEENLRRFDINNLLINSFYAEFFYGLSTDSPGKLLGAGKFNKTSVIIGVARDDGSIFMSGVPGEDKALISLAILFTSTPIILHFETKMAPCYSKCFIVTKQLLENVGKN